MRERSLPFALHANCRREFPGVGLRREQEHSDWARSGGSCRRSNLRHRHHEVAEEMACAIPGCGSRDSGRWSVRGDQSFSRQWDHAARSDSYPAARTHESSRIRRITHHAVAGGDGGVQGSTALGIRPGESQHRLEPSLRSEHLPARYRRLRPHAQSVPGGARHQRHRRDGGVSRHLGRDWHDPRARLSCRAPFSSGRLGSLGTADRLRDLSRVLVRRSELDDALDNDCRSHRIASYNWPSRSRSHQPRPAASLGTPGVGGCSRNGADCGAVLRGLCAARRESRPGPHRFVRRSDRKRGK